MARFATLLGKLTRRQPAPVRPPARHIAAAWPARQTPANDRGLAYSGRLRVTPLCRNTQPKPGRHRADEGPTEILTVNLPTKADRLRLANDWQTPAPVVAEVFR